MKHSALYIIEGASPSPLSTPSRLNLGAAVYVCLGASCFSGLEPFCTLCLSSKTPPASNLSCSHNGAVAFPQREMKYLQSAAFLRGKNKRGGATRLRDQFNSDKRTGNFSQTSFL